MNLTRPISLVRKVIFIIWAVLCFLLFFLNTGLNSYIHQFEFTGWDLFAAGFSRAIQNSYIVDVFVASVGMILFGFSCVGLGVFFLGLLKMRLVKTSDPRLAWAAYFSTAFIIGELVVSSVFLLLGNYSMFTTRAIIVVLVVMNIPGLFHGFRLFANKVPAKYRTNLTNSFSHFEKFLTIASFVIIFLTLLFSSARLSYDAVGFYFSNAKIIALSERIQYFSDFFVVSNLHVGIQYSALMKMFGDQAARMYSWLGGVVILIYCLSIGNHLGLNRRTLLIWMVMIVTSTAFMDLMGDGKIDLQTSAPMMATVYWVIVSRKASFGKSIYFLIGLLAGYSIILRLFNAFLAFLFISAYYLWRINRHCIDGKIDWKLLFQQAFGVGTGFFLLLGFHFWINELVLGDPLAPFKTLAWLDSSIWHYPFDQKDIWLYRILLPFVLTFLNSPQSLGNITPLFVVFSPLVLSSRVRGEVKFSKDVAGISLIVLSILIIWIVSFYMIVEIRYIFFVWLLLFMPISILVDFILDDSEKIIQIITRILLSVLLLFTLIRVVLISFATYSPIDANGDPKCYDFILCDFFRPLSDVAGAGDRVLALNAYRYYMRSDLFACSSKADEYLRLQEAETRGSDAFWEEVVRQGYTYLAFERNFTKRHLIIQFVPEPENLPSWLALETISEGAGKDLVVYRLLVDNPPVVPEKVCVESKPGVWLIEDVNNN